MAVQTLADWITANPEHTKYLGTAAGVAICWQVGTAGAAPVLTADKWNVTDIFTALPETGETASNVDITTVGKTSRSLLNTVPDAPAASDLEVPVTNNPKELFAKCQEIVDAYQGTLEAGDTFYMATYLGEGHPAKVFAAQVSWSKNIDGTFSEELTTTVSITPDLGTYNELVEITNVGG